MSTGENTPLSERLRGLAQKWRGRGVHGIPATFEQCANEVARVERELAEWRDPDSDRRQAIQDEIILGIGDGQRSEVDLREWQLSLAEASLRAVTSERDTLRTDARDLARTAFIAWWSRCRHEDGVTGSEHMEKFSALWDELLRIAGEEGS